MTKYHYTSYRQRKIRTRKLAFYIILFVLMIVVLFLIIHSLGKSPQDASLKKQPADKPERIAVKPLEPEVKPKRKLAPSSIPPLLPTPTPPAVAEPDLAQAAADITSGLNTEAADLIRRAQDDLAAGRLIAARYKFNDALKMPLNPAQQKDVKKVMSLLADTWLFSSEPLPGDDLCDTYLVKSGDLLQNIAKDHKVPYQILMQINNIPRAEALQAGKKIKVINGPFNVVVHRKTFSMDVYLQTTYVRSFDVGLGMAGSETPTGLWRVEKGGKLEKPTWTDPNGRTYTADDPDYPLGSKWIGLEGLEGQAKGRIGFAFHGTKDANSISHPSSLGCIRLHNGDVILLSNMLEPVYSHVRVVEF
ncbi:MAG: L,D-transpeptidase family protein [Planctomycetota bacterium]